MISVASLPKRVSPTSRPLQVIPYSEKTPAWYADNLDFCINKSNFNFGMKGGRKDLQVLYQAYNNIFPMSWFTHITDPLNAKKEKNKKYPAKIRPLNMLRTNLDQLLAEYPRRPFTYNVENLGESGYNRHNDQMAQAAQGVFMQYFQQAALQQAKENGRQLSPEEEQQLMQDPPMPEQAKAEFQTSYKDEKAIKGQKWLRRIIRDQEIKRKIHRGFKHWLITGEVYSYKSIENDRLVYRDISPMNIDYEISEQQIFVEDADWVVCREFYTPSQATDKFYRVLTENQNKYITDNPTTIAYLRTPIAFCNHIGNGIVNGQIPCYHVQWKGRKKIGFLSYFDTDTFQLVEDVVDEDYIVDRNKGEIVEWRWVNEIYEGWRITEDIYVETQACPYQRNPMNNHSACKLSYNGRKHSNTHAENVAVLEIGLPLQIMHIITGYIIEKTIAKSKGKIAMIDKNTLGGDNEEWDEETSFYYADAMGYMLIDRNQPGVDKSWNQYQVLDLSLFDQIKQLIELQASFRAQWDELLGMNRQRKGQTYSSDGLGVNERATFQSTVITDMIFIPFDEFTERELQGLMDLGKFATAKGVYAVYNGDDYQSALMEIDPEDFMDEDFGVFQDNSSENLNKLNEMKSMSESMVQNGHKASTVLEVIDAINVAELRQVLRRIEAIDAEIEQQQQQTEHDAEAAADERKKQFMQYDNLLKKEFMEAEMDRKDDQLFMKIAGETFTFQNGDSNANGIPDATEVQKLVDARNKMTLDYQDKVAKRGQKDKELQQKKQELEHNMKMDKEANKIAKFNAGTARIKARQRPAKTKSK